MFIRKLKTRPFLAAAAAALALPAVAKATTIAGIYGDFYGGNTTGVYTLTATVAANLGGYNGGTTSNSIVLEDGTGGIQVYDISTSLYAIPDVGDDVTITATDSAYGNAPELEDPTAFTVTGNSGPVAPIPLTNPQFNAINQASPQEALAPYANSLVELQNVTLSTTATTAPTVTSISTSANTTYNLTDANGVVAKLYDYYKDAGVKTADTSANSAETASGGTLFSNPINVIGYVADYNGTVELYPLSITAGSAAPEPTSLGLMAIAAVGLLARRRSRA